MVIKAEAEIEAAAGTAKVLQAEVKALHVESAKLKVGLESAAEEMALLTLNLDAARVRVTECRGDAAASRRRHLKVEEECAQLEAQVAEFRRSMVH